MENTKCPFCDEIQKKHWETKSWKYGKNNVTRFECQCGKNFNLYVNGPSSYTIPKKIVN